ncbi:hypothetical protein [Acidocella facilis]|uniref:hypothetical protein n=1 Tax=Acidocella facilis TaxID=525 RepID=UPI00047EA58F|nr:hypothetical protein [Acidocella facilis]
MSAAKFAAALAALSPEDQRVELEILFACMSSAGRQATRRAALRKLAKLIAPSAAPYRAAVEVERALRRFERSRWRKLSATPVVVGPEIDRLCHRICRAAGDGAAVPSLATIRRAVEETQ